MQFYLQNYRYLCKHKEIADATYASSFLDRFACDQLD